MRANPISGYCHYVTSVTKIREARCVAGHGVSQGTLKEVMCGGTPFQDTANIIEKIYPTASVINIDPVVSGKHVGIRSSLQEPTRSASARRRSMPAQPTGSIIMNTAVGGAEIS